MNLPVLEIAQAWAARRADPGQFYGNVGVEQLEKNRGLIVSATDSSWTEASRKTRGHGSSS